MNKLYFYFIRESLNAACLFSSLNVPFKIAAGSFVNSSLEVREELLITISFTAIAYKEAPFGQNIKYSDVLACIRAEISAV